MGSRSLDLHRNFPCRSCDGRADLLMMKFIRDLFTEDDDGKIWDLVRVGSGGGIVFFIGNSVWTVIHAGTVDLQAFGLGFAGMISGVGGAIGLKAAGEQVGT